ncbi:MAG: ABC transporter permease [Elusimicrobia bacterium]|nr:ABC transporter permease [Elusimicrobiota bacterium]
MSYELFIAWRYLTGKRAGFFSWITTFIGVGGVTLGVAAMIVTLAVMNGFHRDIQNRILGTQAHLFVTASLSSQESQGVRKKLEAYPEVEATAPFAAGQAVLLHQGRSLGAWLKGIVPQEEFRINHLRRTLQKGRWEGGLVLGRELAQQLKAGVGDRIYMLSPHSTPSPLGPLPRFVPMEVSGIYHSGYYEYDSSLAFLPLEKAQSFFSLGDRISGVGAKLHDWEGADAFAGKLQRDLGGLYGVRSWTQMNQALFGALKLEKAMMSLLLALIVVVAAFNIASNLLLLSLEKTKEIGILKSLGASSQNIRRIFFYKAGLTALGGVLGGLLLGLALCGVIARYEILELPAEIYYLSKVPIHIRWLDTLGVLVAASGITLLASLYPAHRAGKLKAVEALRYG